MKDCWKSEFENEALLLRPPDLMLINVRKGYVRSYRKLGGNSRKMTKTKPLKIEWNETLRNDCNHQYRGGHMSITGKNDHKDIKGYFLANGHVFSSRQVFRLDDKPKLASKRVIRTLEKCTNNRTFSKCSQTLDKTLKIYQGSSKFKLGEKIELNFKLGQNKIPNTPIYKISCPSADQFAETKNLSCPEESHIQVLRKGRLLKFTVTLHAEEMHRGKYILSLYDKNTSDVIEISKSVNIGGEPKARDTARCLAGEVQIFEYHRDCDGTKSKAEGYLCCRNQLTASVRTQCPSSGMYGRSCSIKKLKAKNMTPEGPTIMPTSPETLTKLGFTDPINIIEPPSAENPVMKIFGGVISVIFIAIFLLILKFKPRTTANDGIPNPNLNENHLPGAIQNNRIDSTFSLSNISNDSVFIN